MARKIRKHGEGSVYFSQGRWRAQACQNGIRKSFHGNTKKECLEWLRKTLHPEQQVPDVVLEKGITTGDYLCEWFENTQYAIRPKTAHQYNNKLHQLILPGLGSIPLNELNLRKIESFYGELLKEGRGARTVRFVHSVLHRALEKAVRYDLITRNPAHGAALPRWSPGEMNVLDQKQVSSFLSAAESSRYQTLYHMAVVTGMRLSELFGLQWADVDWISSRIRVQRQAQRVSGQGWIWIEPKTKAGRRVIPVGARILESLRQQQERQKLEKDRAGKRWVENDLIFNNRIGNPMDASNMRLDYNNILQKAGVPKIRFHDLRHTAASLMLNHGIPVIVVSKILGHSKPSVTIDIYGHLYLEILDEAAQIMNELVCPIGAIKQTSE